MSGARRQENRWDPKENEQVVPEDKTTSKRLYDDAMFKLEHGYADKRQAGAVQPTLSKLTAKRQKLWQDDYAANCLLRQQFRVSEFVRRVFSCSGSLLVGSTVRTIFTSVEVFSFCFLCQNSAVYSMSILYTSFLHLNSFVGRLYEAV